MREEYRKEDRAEERPEDRIRAVKKTDPAYPPALRVYERMPGLLYVRGRLPDPQKKSVAIVGARSCSAYGKKEAQRFAGVLAENGVQIISGMALGVDSWAHIGALEAGGITIAVLGSGIDVCYPVSHGELYRRILESGGGILSEYGPGTPAMPHHFPIRNRIISALADIVLVVEARKKSGSLITASYALEQGKNIYAVPGRNGDPLSEGCNRLIADGAGVAWEPEILLEELGLGYRKKKTEQKTEKKELPPHLQKDEEVVKVYENLTFDCKNLTELSADTSLSVPGVSRAVIRLCLAGCAAGDPGTGYIRT